ncbi:unnamed protein product [Arabidopsis lyrata]|uniref:Uncharacterized protein n=1 Tax=Arabidopsis lyrata subsp. lyrata TaxID=81972 RepID=D7M354_ARALL|nr:hypothetical protein ARALYDRAFT_910488 [Arabidopsis lyrata subsp. lyrata]CAH8272111.1 unnamed protein product [Arabidopsis lyrata]
MNHRAKPKASHHTNFFKKGYLTYWISLSRIQYFADVANVATSANSTRYFSNPFTLFTTVRSWSVHRPNPISTVKTFARFFLDIFFSLTIIL